MIDELVDFIDRLNDHFADWLKNDPSIDLKIGQLLTNWLTDRSILLID